MPYGEDIARYYSNHTTHYYGDSCIPPHPEETAMEDLVPLADDAHDLESAGSETQTTTRPGEVAREIELREKLQKALREVERLQVNDRELREVISLMSVEQRRLESEVERWEQAVKGSVTINQAAPVPLMTRDDSIRAQALEVALNVAQGHHNAFEVQVKNVEIAFKSFYNLLTS